MRVSSVPNMVYPYHGSMTHLLSQGRGSLSPSKEGKLIFGRRDPESSPWSRPKRLSCPRPPPPRAVPPLPHPGPMLPPPLRAGSMATLSCPSPGSWSSPVVARTGPSCCAGAPAARSRGQNDVARLGQQRNCGFHRCHLLTLPIQSSIHGGHQAKELIQLFRVSLCCRIVLDAGHGGRCVSYP
jgi:hypothetical protein